MKQLTHQPLGLAVVAATCLLTGVTPSADASDASNQIYDRVDVSMKIRDFNQSHPDFESNYQRHPSIGNGATPGIVLDELDAQGKPVANPDHIANGFKNGLGRLITSEAHFAEWYRDVPGTNIRIDQTIFLEWNPSTNTYVFEKSHSNSNGFFPITGQGFGETMRSLEGIDQNYHFTTEIEMPFRYTSPESRPGRPLVFEFFGDDDVWVFLNGKLILDIGGVHPQVNGAVNIDEIAAEHGLVPGELNMVKVFHAERRWAHSNFRIETSLPLIPTILVPLYD